MQVLGWDLAFCLSCVDLAGLLRFVGWYSTGLWVWWVVWVVILQSFGVVGFGLGFIDFVVWVGIASI